MIELIRTTRSVHGTFGMLLSNGQPLCLTCEPPWRMNEVSKSCIPEGYYEYQAHVAPKFDKCWHILDVPHRTEILIHVGNTIKDTYGCILPGMRVGDWAVHNSKDAMNRLRQYLGSGGDIKIRSA